MGLARGGNPAASGLIDSAGEGQARGFATKKRSPRGRRALNVEKRMSKHSMVSSGRLPGESGLRVSWIVEDVLCHGCCV